jgi:thiol-disulfide isomerase/thioredoxin
VIPVLLHVLLSFSSITASPSLAKDNLKIVDFEGLESYLEQFGDRTVVINFWATWCVPCVKELPYFEQVTKSYPQEDLVVVLVSLDFSKQIDTKLKPFLKKHQLQSQVVLLNDPDQNSWIDKVDPRWSGAIPVTVIRKGDRKEFYERTFHSYNELNAVIQTFQKT